MEWVFNGIGTQIVLCIISALVGAAGYQFYQKHGNNQSQKAGNGTIQIQNYNHPTAKEPGIESSVDGANLSIELVNGYKTTIHEWDEQDIRNFTRYSNSQIEKNVLSQGNDATRRAWCLELILNQRPDYLICKFIEKMENDQEKYTLLKSLADRNFADSEYFVLILESLSNNTYIAKAIKLCFSIGKVDCIKSIFKKMQNNKYIFDCLVEAYEYNKDVFKQLYDNGNCLTNQKYKDKMSNWLIQQKNETPGIMPGAGMQSEEA